MYQWNCIILSLFFGQILVDSVFRNSIQSTRDLQLALGERHVQGHFPSGEYLIAAIEHAWNVFSRNRNVDRTVSLKHDFVFCTTYHDNGEVANYCKRNDITRHISYSSFKNDKVCSIAHVSAQDLRFFQTSEDITFTLFLPVPSVLKIEHSVHHYLSWLSNFAIEDANKSSRHASVLINQSNAEQPIELSIVLKSTLTRLDDARSVISECLASLSSRNKKNGPASNTMHDKAPLANALTGVRTDTTVQHQAHPYEDIKSDEGMLDAWESFFWTSSTSAHYFRSISSLLELKQLRRLQLINDRNEKSSRTNTFSVDIPFDAHLFNVPPFYHHYGHTGFSRHSSTLEDAAKLSSMYRDMWLSFKESIDAMYTKDTHKHICKWTNISHSTMQYRNRSVIISIPKYLTTKSKGEGNGDGKDKGVGDLLTGQNMAACLSELITEILNHPSVVRVALTRPLRLLNDFTRGIVQSGQKYNEPYSQLGLNGTNQIVGVSDTGIDQNSCYFRDTVNGPTPSCSLEDLKVYPHQRKVVQYIAYSGSSADYRDGHGSHVCGIIAGSCEDTKQAEQKFHGMAPAAKLAFFDIGPVVQGTLAVPSDLTHIFHPAFEAGARTYSNSWGGDYWYDIYSIEVDEYLYTHPDFVLVFAGGNDGTNGHETILSPALAKNAIAVAASDVGHSGGSIGSIASFSSVGPSPDGRIKPDVTAPGLSVYSTDASSEDSGEQTCRTQAKSGTSMAAPVVGGNIALIRQYFDDEKFWSAYCNPIYPYCQRGPFVASGSLIKALLIHSGTSMNKYEGFKGVSLGEAPDIYQGYGRVTLSSILPLLASNKSPWQLFVDFVSLTELSEVVYDVDVTDSTQPFIVTISWFDPPNAVFAAKVLLHDIDLVVEDPNNQVFYGNTHSLSGVPPADSVRDEYNNNEKIKVAVPVIGTWKVHIQAKRLTEALAQNVSIVITAGGHVGGDGMFHTPHALSPDALQQCKAAPIMHANLELSKWSMVDSSGWSNDNSYQISRVNVESDSILVSGSFQNTLAYELDNVCLSADCYEVQLHLSASTHVGTQLSIPSCNVHVSPLATSNSFCISNPEPYVSQGGGGAIYSTLVFPKKFCYSTCEMGDHVSIDLILLEFGGEGWLGSYYAMQRISTPSNDISSPSNDTDKSFLEDNGFTSGTLEWGFMKEETVCLPPESACYFIALSIATASEVYPYIEFNNSGWITSNDDDNAAQPCPFVMQSNVSLAKVCVDLSVNAAFVSFYQTTDHPVLSDYGEYQSDWNSFVQNALSGTDTSIIGDCKVPISTNFDSKGKNSTNANNHHHHHYTSPKDITYRGHDLSCFQSCSNFNDIIPKDSFLMDDEMNIDENVCFFLMTEVYLGCGSYSISQGSCLRAQCATSCSISDFCYFGAASVVGCSTESKLSIDSLTVESIFKECSFNIAYQEQKGGSKVGDEHYIPSSNSLGLSNVAVNFLIETSVILSISIMVAIMTCLVSQNDYRLPFSILPSQESSEHSVTSTQDFEDLQSTSPSDLNVTDNSKTAFSPSQPKGLSILQSISQSDALLRLRPGASNPLHFLDVQPNNSLHSTDDNAISWGISTGMGGFTTGLNGVGYEMVDLHASDEVGDNNFSDDGEDVHGSHTVRSASRSADSGDDTESIVEIEL